MSLERLKDRDYVIVVDKSGSMSMNDCPGGKTRWDYAYESTGAIARKLQEFDPDGITVVPFSSAFKIHENVTAEKVDEVWREHEPMGSTNLTAALKQIFADYNTRKKAGETKANGEMLVIMTDGSPNDPSAVMKTIIEFGNQLDNADDEYGISFIQVGKDPGAAAFLQKLDDDLVGLGAKHDIVDTKSMDEVETIGLLETLVAALDD